MHSLGMAKKVNNMEGFPTAQDAARTVSRQAFVNSLQSGFKRAGVQTCEKEDKGRTPPGAQIMKPCLCLVRRHKPDPTSTKKLCSRLCSRPGEWQLVFMIVTELQPAGLRKNAERRAAWTEVANRLKEPQTLECITNGKTEWVRVDYCRRRKTVRWRCWRLF